MRFALIGTLRLSDGNGEPVELPGARQRILLAALLLHANQPVLDDTLAELVWEGSPPAGAAATLRSHLRRLRATIGPGARIVAHRPGYLIQVDADDLDVLLFEALCRDAGAAVRAGRWVAAADLAARALRLWRGTPLLDVPSQPLRDEFVPRLEQLRLQALEHHVEADLHLDRPVELVPELVDLVAAHPLHERFQAQLMRALLRAGRQAEALDAYQRARRALHGRLGVEPGPELRELRRRILVGQPPPAQPPPAQAPAAQVPAAQVPRQLPPAGGRFVGRAGPLAVLDGLLAGAGGAVAAISGTAGVGKTALAVHWAHRHAAAFPDGQLYADLRGFDPTGAPVPAATAVRRFLDALAVPAARLPADQDAQFDLYRSLLAHRRVLVVLDNARDDDQVRPLLPGAATCMVLVTSRDGLAGLVALDGAVPLGLELFSDRESRQLLAARIGPERIAGDRRAADDLVGLCAGLPLALTITAARAATRPDAPLGEVARELRDARLDLLSVGTAGQGDMRTVLSWSYRRLSPAAARLFRLLSLHPGPDVSATAAASLAGTGPRPTRRVLDELTGAHLLTATAGGRYGYHDLLRAYAAELAQRTDSADDRREARLRALDHYLHGTYVAYAALHPGRSVLRVGEARPGVTVDRSMDPDEALAWYRAEHPALAAVVALAAGTGADAHAWQILQGWAPYLDRRGRWHELAAVSRTALEAAERAGDRAGQSLAHRWLGDAFSRLGAHAEAYRHLRRGLALDEELGDRDRQGNTHHALAMVFERQHRFTEALRHERRALELYREIGYRAGQARALNALGWFHAMLARHDLALDYCQQALELAREIGSPDIEATILDSIGYAHDHLGHHAEAVDHYTRALRIFRSTGELFHQAEILAHLGDTYHSTGRQAAARDAWQQALALYLEVHHPSADDIQSRLHKQDQG